MSANLQENLLNSFQDFPGDVHPGLVGDEAEVSKGFHVVYPGSKELLPDPAATTRYGDDE